MAKVEVKERFSPEEIAAITALVETSTASDGHVPLGGDKWLELLHGKGRDFVGIIATENDDVAGYAQLSRGATDWSLEYVVHPDHRGNASLLGRTLLAASLEEAVGRGGGQVHLWVTEPTEPDDTLVNALGFAQERDLFQMRRSLPLEDALVVRNRELMRTFHVGVDEHAWLAVNNAAFAGHPEQGSWHRDDLLRHEQETWFDPAGFFLKEGHDGTLAAFCWTKVHDETPPIGEIYVVGVHPNFQGHGLGKELVLTGLTYLGDRALKIAMLYVDADNENALSLYRSLDFHIVRSDRAYVISVGTPQ